VIEEVGGGSYHLLLVVGVRLEHLEEVPHESAGVEIVAIEDVHSQVTREVEVLEDLVPQLEVVTDEFAQELNGLVRFIFNGGQLHQFSIELVVLMDVHQGLSDLGGVPTERAEASRLGCAD
jgi:hypothetical protein